MLIVGASDRPYAADKAKDLKAMTDFFKKIIFLPLPDYASRTALWAEGMRRAGVRQPPDDAVQALAQLSDSYSSGTIMRITRQQLTRRRLDRLDKKPLEAAEFIPTLAKETPVYRADDAAMYSWYAKVYNLNQREPAPPPEAGKGKGAKGKAK